MTKVFLVQKGPLEDIGKDRVRIHYLNRLERQRFSILCLEHENKTALVSALGHEGTRNVIQMDINLRKKLDVKDGDLAKITVSVPPWWKKLCWYFHATDPIVYIPARIALWSLGLSIAGCILGLLSLF